MIGKFVLPMPGRGFNHGLVLPADSVQAGLLSQKPPGEANPAGTTPGHRHPGSSLVSGNSRLAGLMIRKLSTKLNSPVGGRPRQILQVSTSKKQNPQQGRVSRAHCTEVFEKGRPGRMQTPTSVGRSAIHAAGTVHRCANPRQRGKLPGSKLVGGPPAERDFFRRESFVAKHSCFGGNITLGK